MSRHAEQVSLVIYVSVNFSNSCYPYCVCVSRERVRESKREYSKLQKITLFCLMRTLCVATSTWVESQGLLLYQPLLSALYANTHFSINLAVHSEAFDIALAFCKVIYPEFIWPLGSPGGMTPLITNLNSVYVASEETEEVTVSKPTVSLHLEKVLFVVKWHWLSHISTTECWVIIKHEVPQFVTDQIGNFAWH